MIRKLAGGTIAVTLTAVALASLLGGGPDRRDEIAEAGDCIAVARIVHEETRTYRASVEAGKPDVAAQANIEAGQARQRELGCRR